MANKIQFKRGTKANLPALSVGEPGFCTDTKELFIGASDGNVQIVDQAQFAAHLAENATETQKGHVEFATASEISAGTDNTRAIHPAGLKSILKGYRIYDSLGGVNASFSESTPIIDLIEGMAEKSILVVTIGSNAGGVYPIGYATLSIIKINNSRNIVQLVANDGKSFLGTYHQSTLGWSGWKVIYNSRNVTVSTSAPTSYLGEDYQHQVY